MRAPCIFCTQEHIDLKAHFSLFWLDAIVCNANDITVDAMLGQKNNKVIHLMYYGSKTFNKTQENYTTIENELLAIIFALENFQS